MTASPVVERLLALAVEQTGMSREQVVAEIADPQWLEAERMHD